MKILMLTVLSVFAAPQDAKDEGTDKKEVAKVVRNAVEGVVSVLQNKGLSRTEKRAAVIGIVDPLIDFELLARLSLGRKHWKAIDDEQRESFTELFVETLQLSYFEKLELFTDEVVEFEEPVPIKTKGAPKYNVLSYIVSKGERIKVAYHLYQSEERKGPWRVYDFEIEGVSIRKSYAEQYGDYLRGKSFDELLKTMREKVKEIREKNGERESKDTVKEAKKMKAERDSEDK